MQTPLFFEEINYNLVDDVDPNRFQRILDLENDALQAETEEKEHPGPLS